MENFWHTLYGRNRSGTHLCNDPMTMPDHGTDDVNSQVREIISSREFSFKTFTFIPVLTGTC